MSGGGGGGTTTSTQVNYSPEEAAQRAKVMEEANRIYSTTGQNIANSPYPGAAPVPYGAHTAAAMNNLWGYSANQLPQQLQQYNNSLNFSLKDVLYPESNPALQAYMQSAIRPITQSYMDPGGVMSQIRTQAGDANQVGSSRQGIAEGLAARGYQQAVGDTTAKIANTAYGQGLDAMKAAQMLAPTYAQMGTMPAQLQGQIGSMFDTQQQQFADYDAAARMWALNAPWTPLQNYANIVFGGASPGTTATAEANGGTNWGNKALGAVGGGLAGGYAALGTSIGGLPGMMAGALLGALMS